MLGSGHVRPDELRSIVYASHTASGLEESDLPALRELIRWFQVRR
ncbi:hypothetical protein [Rathayibacter sp. VKM Ac-2759]|nr:hypothetical protein [Rathayibacter sp. VKM Ac-2759]